MSVNGKLCRMCAEIVKSFLNIYDNDCDDIQYISKFKQLFTDILFEEDNYSLPEHICSNCCTKLKDAYSFKKQCVSSMDYLKKRKRNFQEREPEHSNLEDVDIKQEDFNEMLIENSCENIEAQQQNENSDKGVHFQQNENQPEEVVASNCSSGPLKKEHNKTISEYETKGRDKEELGKMHDSVVLLTAPFKDVHHNLADGYQSERESNATTPVMTNYYLTLNNVKTDMGNAKAQDHKSDDEEREKEQKVYSCFMCGNSFKFQFDFETHLTIAHINQTEQENAKVDTGKNRFVAGNVIKTKEEIEIKEELTKCNAEEDEEGGKVKTRMYSCTVCQKQFHQKKCLRQHMVIHNDEKKHYSCNECHKQFSWKYSLTKHVNSVHKHIKPYSCKQCHKNFSENWDLKQHVKCVHEGIKPYSCKECQKKFCEKKILEQHVKSVHRGVKPYSCKKCHKQFSQKGHFKEHTIIVHTGVKPYSCKECHKHFSRKSTLKRHMICVHKDQKPYSCNK